MGPFARKAFGPSRRLWMVAAAMIFLASAFGLGVARLKNYPFIVKPEVKFITDTRLAKLISLGHEGFLSDLLFIQVNLHSGSLGWKPSYIDFDSKWAYAMMDVITDLDPRFYTAYLFSGMGLVHYHGDAKLARPILDKGMKQFPDSWELPFWAGYLCLNRLEDAQTGADYLWQAYNKPHAPRQFVSIMLSALRQAGNFDLAAKGMAALMAAEKNPNLKIIYQKKMIRFNNLDILLKAARVLQEKTGKSLQTLEDLVKAGIIPGIPEDPDGLGYRWNKASGLPEPGRQGG